MSLTRTLTRIATVKALTGATLASDQVFDSAIDPYDTRVTVDARPMIVVYTDDEETEVSGRGDWLQGGVCELVIEIVVAGLAPDTPYDAPDPDGDGPHPDPAPRQLQIPRSDAGLELTLDMIEGQVIRTLTGDQEPWAQAWRGLVVTIIKRLSRRGASAEQGNRYAVRQLVISCEMVTDPAHGGVIGPQTPWGRALGLMEANEDEADLARILRIAAEGVPLADWRREAARLGVSLETVEALGIGPAGAPDGTLLAEVNVVRQEPGA